MGRKSVYLNIFQNYNAEHQQNRYAPHKKAIREYLYRYVVLQACQYELGLSVGLIDDDLFRWRLCFQGPENTHFEGGLYEATLTFPNDFPQMPPKMVFKTEMFHPNSMQSAI